MLIFSCISITINTVLAIVNHSLTRRAEIKTVVKLKRRTGPRVCCEHKTRDTRLQLNMQITNVKNLSVSLLPTISCNSQLIISVTDSLSLSWSLAMLLPPPQQLHFLSTTLNDRKTPMWQLIKQRVEPFTLMIPEREFLQDDMEKSDLCWKRELVDDILTPNILLLLTCGAIVASPYTPHCQHS